MTLEASETSDFDSSRLAIRLLGPGVLLVALVVVAFIPCLRRFVYIYDVCLGFAVIVLEAECTPLPCDAVARACVCGGLRWVALLGLRWSG